MSAAAPSTSAIELDVEGDALIEARREREPHRLAGREWLVALAGALAFLAAALPLALVADRTRSPSLAVVVLLVLAYAAASRVEFEVGIGFAVPTQLVFVPMLFLLPAAVVPLAVAAGFLVGNLYDYARGREHPLRSLVLLVSSWHAVGPALVLIAAGRPEAEPSAWAVLLAVLGAQFAFDFASMVVHARFAFGVSPLAQLRAMAWSYGVDVALTPIGFLVAVAAAERPYALLAVLPLLGLFGLFARERAHRIDHALELGKAYRGTAFLLGDVIEADDAYTGSHSRDVVRLVLAVGEELGLDAREQRRAELTALLHDVGKIRIPAEIIGKPGALDAEEWEVLKTHTIEGERMLARVGGLLGSVGHVVRSCHERWDGSGYPDGLRGEEIPLLARIVCCCDALSAMTADRPYRSAVPLSAALAELERCAGSQFDPAVVAALVAVVGRGAHAEHASSRGPNRAEKPPSNTVDQAVWRSSPSAGGGRGAGP